MATISSPNATTVIHFLPNSNHWRLVGLEVTTSYVSTVNTSETLVTLGLQSDNSTAISVQSQLPASIIFDRIYIHGLSNSNSLRGIEMDAQGIAVVDSYCDEIHSNGQDSQCFASWNGVGPFLIQNNFIQAGAEDIMFGGADPSITNLVPSDITVVGNVIQKNLAWRTEAAPYNWVIKNLIEFKNAQRVLLDGNVIQYIWAQSQSGTAIPLTPRNQEGNCPWCSVNDITITHNLIRHAGNGIAIAGGDTDPAPSGPSLPTARVLIQNNVLDDISSANWGGDGRTFFITSSVSAPTAYDITFDHDTAFPNVTDLFVGDSGTVGNTAFSNDLWNYGNYGVIGTNTAVGVVTLSSYIPLYTWRDIIFVTGNGTSDGNVWPSNTFWTTPSGAQFTNFAAGNYQLLATSPYHAAGTDGQDIGVWDWTCLNYDSAAALAGTFVPNAGCASSNDLPLPPTGLTATVQ